MCTGTHAFISVPTTAKVELIYEIFSQRIENVLHFKKTEDWSESDCRDLALSIEPAWISTFKPVLSTAADLVLVRVTDLSTEDSFGFETEPSSAAVGAETSPGMPLNVTVASKFTGGRTGRSQRGRAYWPVLTEAKVGGNTLAGGIADECTNTWLDFFAQVSAANHSADPVVVSYCHNGAWRTVAQTTIITSVSTDFNIDSMRRRLNGRGL